MIMEEKKSMDIKQLLEAMAGEMGRKPETMVLLSEVNEKAVFEHVANKNFAMSGEQIPPKYKMLISLAVAAALGSEPCINNYTQVALKKGISKEELVETLLLTRFVKGSTVMSASTAALRLMVNKE
jgi:AhpD family alkylhydroperoxidase